MRTDLGSRAVQRAGSWLKNVWPSRYDGIAKAADRVYMSPNGRTFGEWLLINKVLAPVSFPAKLALANRIVNQRALAGAALTAVAAAEMQGNVEPDLTEQAAEQAAEKLVRSVSETVLPPATATIPVVLVRSSSRAGD